MGVCCCSLAGTAACRHCPNNEYAEEPIRRNDVAVSVPYLSEITYDTKETEDGTVYSATRTVFVGDVGAKKTNGDKIRSMNDKDLAGWLSVFTVMYCKSADDAKCMWLNWLKEEVKDEQTDVLG